MATSRQRVLVARKPKNANDARQIVRSFQSLGKEGYAGIRLAEVAQVARSSRGGLLHFPTKDDLVAHTIERAYDKLLARTRDRVSHLGATDDPVAAMIADSRDLFFSEFFFIILEMGLTRGKSNAITLLTSKFRLPTENAYREALVARGLARDLADEVVFLALSVVRGLSIRRLVLDEPERFDRTFEFFREILWTYLTAKESEERQRGR